MRDDALRRLTDLPSGHRVLDVGGWAAPLARADAVIDLLPYDTRGLYGHADPDRERFTAADWAQADICGPDPWPFPDGAFDVAVCSHTLEDVRDPVFVCRELSRVARGGYVEVPAPVEELTAGVQGPWTGWSHHRWISERETVDGRDGLVFTHKPHLLAAGGRHLPPGSHLRVPEERRVLAWWWDGALPAREQVHVDADGFDRWLDGILTRAAAEAGVTVASDPVGVTAGAGAGGAGRAAAGRVVRAARRRARVWKDARR
ncbi:MAG: class I SAM-dependent methyltransferase [Solirubrobacteraceae bacterium]|nr:class I SAM-dependent methyltransferase [Solirubrobacteraceae bacterium]